MFVDASGVCMRGKGKRGDRTTRDEPRISLSWAVGRETVEGEIDLKGGIRYADSCGDGVY